MSEATITPAGYEFASEPRPIKNKKTVLVRTVKPTFDEQHRDGADQKAKKKQFVVATPAELSPTKKQKPQQEFPLSLLTTKAGPKRDDEGKYVGFSLLGDSEEYADM